jgi:hypothetical protein
MLNLGLRYDFYAYPTEVHDRQSNFDLTTGTLVLPGEDGFPRAASSTATQIVGRRGLASLMTWTAVVQWCVAATAFSISSTVAVSGIS